MQGRYTFIFRGNPDDFKQIDHYIRARKRRKNWEEFVENWRRQFFLCEKHGVDNVSVTRAIAREICAKLPRAEVIYFDFQPDIPGQRFYICSAPDNPECVEFSAQCVGMVLTRESDPALYRAVWTHRHMPRYNTTAHSPKDFLIDVETDLHEDFARMFETDIIREAYPDGVSTPLTQNIRDKLVGTALETALFADIPEVILENPDGSFYVSANQWNFPAGYEFLNDVE